MTFCKNVFESISSRENEEELKESVRTMDLTIPTLQEIKEEFEKNPDMQSISNRIKDTIFVINNFK